jgi:hypothetical protein
MLRAQWTDLWANYQYNVEFSCQGFLKADKSLVPVPSSRNFQDTWAAFFLSDQASEWAGWSFYTNFFGLIFWAWITNLFFYFIFSEGRFKNQLN